MKQNLHTHTVYCDGKNTPREMVEKAIELGFSSIGFSGHSRMVQNRGWSMTETGQARYLQEIEQLKREYADRIRIFKGVEYDIYSGIPMPEVDYSIGSVHGLMINGQYVEFDAEQTVVQDIIDTWFAGNGMRYAQRYYEAVAQIPQSGDFDIIGHIDVVAKHCENVKFFDENAKEYLAAAIGAMEALQGKIRFFEVNTGAIARGYRTTPYPSIPLLKELKRLGFDPVITSDCHDANRLDCCFDDARQLLLHCGFRESFILTENGFAGQKL